MKPFPPSCDTPPREHHFRFLCSCPNLWPRSLHQLWKYCCGACPGETGWELRSATGPVIAGRVGRTAPAGLREAFRAAGVSQVWEASQPLEESRSARSLRAFFRFGLQTKYQLVTGVTGEHQRR